MTFQTRTLCSRDFCRLLLTLCMTVVFSCSLNAQGIPLIRNFSATEYKAHNQNFDVITGNDGTVYVANFEGLLYYDNATWRIMHTPGVTRITSVFSDSKGTVWTGGYNYIGYVKHDDKGRLYLHQLKSQDLFMGEVEWIWEKDGKIHFYVSNEKIYSIDNDEVNIEPGASIPKKGFSVYGSQTHVNQIQELEDGIKAIATDGSGVIIVDQYDKELFRITADNGLCSNNVSHITYNNHGIIWGATDNGVFAIGYPSIYTHFTKNEGLRGEVLALAKHNKQIYAGTLSGLYKQQGMNFTIVDQMTHACWQLVHEGSSLLAATANGVYRIDNSGEIRQLTTANTLSLLVDKQGFYSGEMDGVFFNSAEGRKKISDVEKVVKILRDGQGTIWLQNLYGKIWKAFAPYNNTKDENAICTLVEYNNRVSIVTTSTTKPFPYPLFSYNDSQGVVWLTNNKGRSLYAYENDSINRKLSAVTYPLMDLSVRAMLRNENLLWMGGDKGITIADYTHHEPSRANGKPALYLRSILLRGDSVIWGGYGQQINVLPTLASDDHHIIIHFSIDYPSLQLKTQYRTRLNGGKWSAWDNETLEEYANLPFGNHVFEVQARDAFGQMSDIVTLHISIEAPFLLRWYMILLYLILLIVAVNTFMRWRTHRLEREKMRLEELVKVRTDEVVKLEKIATVGKLTQGLIDRILNPLNYINNFAKLSEGLVDDIRDNVEDEKENMSTDNYEDTMDVLDMLKGNLVKVEEHGANTTRTLKAMEEIMKDRSGGIAKMNLTTLLLQNKEMVLKYYKEKISQLDIKTVFDLPSGEIFINGNAEQLSKMFMNLLGNAVYAVAKKTQRLQDPNYVPEIRLTSEVNGKKLLLHFHDNGIGIEHTILNKVFDPFFTTKTTSEASGIGLYLSHEIVQHHGGDISVQSEKNVYTEFTITLPII